MKTVKILFRFTFKDGSTMQVSHSASSYNSDDCTISQVWQNMSKTEFVRKLITKTVKIEVVKIENGREGGI